MASEVVDQSPVRVRRGVINTCLECRRRKQKCNRKRPCNFCAARGVPEKCRYDPLPQRSTRDVVLQQVEQAAPLACLKIDRASAIPASPPDLLDQVGYSSASRRTELEQIVERHPRDALRSINAHTSIAIADCDLYLTLVTRLPSVQIISGLIDLYFSIENWSFSVLDQHRFQSLYSQFKAHLESKTMSNGILNLSSTLITFPALLCSVLAVTLQCITLDTQQARELDLSTLPECMQLSQWYLDTGQEIVGIFEQQKPTTTSIEFYLMKMSWLKNCGRGSESWQSLGTALRQAQQIDLHQIPDGLAQNPRVNIEETLSRLWELEYQRRLWARIFIMDSHMAIGLGRPRGINREDCSTSTPLDCDYPPEPLQTVPVSTKINHAPPNIFSPTLFSVALGHRYHDLMSMRASKTDLKDYTRVTNLHDDVESLLTGLSPALRPSFPDTTWDHQQPQLPAVRLRLLTTTQIFLLALHRPYISTHAASRYAATEAAFAILQAQRDLFSIVPQAHHRLYGYSFYVIDASLFLTALIFKFPTSDTSTITKTLQELQQASARLACMKERSTIAKTGETVLLRCCSIVKTHLPSLASTVDLDYLLSVLPPLDYETLNLLQGFGTHIPDQATQDLMSLLADPSMPTNFSATAGPLRSGVLHDEADTSAFDTSVTDDSSFSTMMSQNTPYW